MRRRCYHFRRRRRGSSRGPEHAPEAAVRQRRHRPKDVRGKRKAGKSNGGTSEHDIGEIKVMGISYYLIKHFGLPLTYAYSTLRQSVAVIRHFGELFFAI
jgi:hypothetical protein